MRNALLSDLGSVRTCCVWRLWLGGDGCPSSGGLGGGITSHMDLQARVGTFWSRMSARGRLRVHALGVTAGRTLLAKRQRLCPAVPQGPDSQSSAEGSVRGCPRNLRRRLAVRQDICPTTEHLRRADNFAVRQKFPPQSEIIFFDGFRHIFAAIVSGQNHHRLLHGANWVNSKLALTGR